jgi:broad specificity phosphatase PhoE
MSVFVIRHADKEIGEFYSDNLHLNNQPISENGKMQAANLVNYFNNIEIDSIYVSRYIRTKETIAAVAETKKISPVIDHRLDEVDIGDFEKLSNDQVEKDYPEFWKAYLERDRDFRFPNGESGEEAGTRVFEKFCSLDAAKNHILVAHDGIIRTLLCKVLSIPVYKRHLFSIDLCSVTIFEYSSEFKCWTVPHINMEVG